MNEGQIIHPLATSLRKSAITCLSVCLIYVRDFYLVYYNTLIALSNTSTDSSAQELEPVSKQRMPPGDIL